MRISASVGRRLSALVICLLLGGCARETGPVRTLPESSGDTAAFSEMLPPPDSDAAAVTTTTTATTTTDTAANTTTTTTTTATTATTTKPNHTTTKSSVPPTTGRLTVTTTGKKPTTTYTAAAVQDELRGVWVSYIELDDLLRKATPDTAAAAIDTVMDTCAAKGFNAVFFHARAHSDAYYASGEFPAAASVAKLLKNGFDPLGYAVTAAHKRGLQLHAWINPYRIGKDGAYARLTGEDVFYKGNKWYYNPASAAVRTLILSGVRELLDGYAVDGIHFDDYFYPADMDDGGEKFEHIPAGQDVGDWRRTQVDMLVSAVCGLTRSKKRVFGISPAGNLENCYSSLFADVALWMRRPGYLDYVCPQLYFGFEHHTHAFDKELARWSALPRCDDVQLYIGLGLYKAGLENDTYAGAGAAEWSRCHDIIARQVTLLRQESRVAGFVIYTYDNIAVPSDAARREWAALEPLLLSH